MALAWKTKILLAKIETTYGVDPTPAGANGVLASDITINPMEGNDLSRNLELPTLGAQTTIPIELHAKLAFKIELAGAGAAGTAPAWGPLLRACGVAQVIEAGVKVPYNPVSFNHESIAFYFWIAGTRYVIVGARGNVTFRINAQANPVMEFEFTGLFRLASEQARVTPVLAGFQKPRAGTTLNTPVCTFGGTTFVLREFSLAMGNAIENRFLIGSEGVIITDRAEQVEARVEAVPLTTFNPYQAALDQTDVAIAIDHGTVAGNIIRLRVPKGQMQRPSGLENSQNVVEWPLRLVPQPGAAFDDQWTLEVA